MKIFNVKKTRELDEFTLQEEKIQSLELMERAAKAFCDWFGGLYEGRQVMVFCGLGNNGGDGLAIARLLLAKKYRAKAYVIEYAKQTSEDFAANENRLSDIDIKYIREEDGNFPEIPKKTVVIDAIFGSGLSRPVEGFPAALIEHINASGAEIVAVDLPSGLFSDRPSTEGAKIKANRTLSFQLPKLCFMLPQNAEYVGKWETADIGLSKKYIKKTETGAHYVVLKDIQKKISARAKFSHKGTFGHALLLAGSYGKVGAALLAGKACMRAGAGLLTAHLPSCAYDIFQTALPEAMCSTDAQKDGLSKLPEGMDGFAAIAIGPGLGLSETTAALLLELFRHYPEKPLVIDADAINLLGKYRQILPFLPKQSILTPHPKEFERLIGGAPADDFERLRMQAAFCAKYEVYVVYKGAHTTIGTPEGHLYFNSSGNPGMATAGSGDSLTGVLLALLAEGHNTLDAALIGVFAHGLAGDIAKERFGERSLMASDICEALPEAFKRIENI